MKEDELPPLVSFALGLAIGAMVGPGLIAVILFGPSIVARAF